MPRDLLDLKRGQSSHGRLGDEARPQAVPGIVLHIVATDSANGRFDDQRHALSRQSGSNVVVSGNRAENQACFNACQLKPVLQGFDRTHRTPRMGEEDGTAYAQLVSL